MEEPKLPTNIYQHLVLLNGQAVVVDRPLPWAKDDPDEVWIIGLEDGTVDTTFGLQDDEGNEMESASSSAAKYLIYTKKARDALREKRKVDVPIYEIWADKVLLQVRMASSEAVLEEFKNLLGGEEMLSAFAAAAEAAASNNGQSAVAPAG